jgi:hypothetical protein
MRPSKPTPAELQLRKENDGLRTTVVCLRSELRHKQDFVGRLEYLLHQRTEMIDALHGRIDQLREQNKRLDAENEHLVEMVRLPPQSLT